MSSISLISLNNGSYIPFLGMALWQDPNHPENNIKHLLNEAIELGIRYFDFSHFYENEIKIGEIIKEKIKKGVLKRKDLFISLKLKKSVQNIELMEYGVKKALNNLQLDYLDLVYIEMEDFDEDDCNKTWKEMERLYKNETIKAIGVCNFNEKNLNFLLKICTITPAVYLLDYHPYMDQLNIQSDLNIRTIQLGLRNPFKQPWIFSRFTNILKNTNIQEIAQRYKRTPSQLMLRYYYQKSNIVLIKFDDLKELKEYMDIMFYVAAEDMCMIKSLLKQQANT
ncbi:unnamed protein product [Brassicogethes aeneus]|uniref:NADP-dependent oxidoreductase domain-containing protein n=1 Tax=Brassicogethes aeneus TaxID=1431903 RepID=A0A9P0FRG5_BRAAE|nr:unnamed protein product [Brassicogethes aeneus]